MNLTRPPISKILLPYPFLLFICLTLPGWCDEPAFKIQSITKAHEDGWINIDGKWVTKCPERFKVSVRVSEEAKSGEVFLKAYVYDKFGNLIRKIDRPHDLWLKTKTGMESVGMPKEFKVGRRYEMYFGISEELEKERPDFILVVFGDKERVDVKTRPDSKNLEDLEFEEKTLWIASKDSEQE